MSLVERDWLLVATPKKVRRSRPARARLGLTIYQATNIVTKECYIGATNDFYRRVSAHITGAFNRNSMLPLHVAIRTYGKQNFKWEVLLKCSTREELLSEEIKIIEQLRPAYNLTKGGMGRLGQKISPKLRDILVARNKERRGIPINRTEKWHKATCRPVLCLNDGKEFASSVDAAKFYGTTKVSVGRVCRGDNITVKIGNDRLVFRFKDQPLDANELEIALSKSKQSREAVHKKPIPVICMNDGVVHYGGVVAAASFYGIGSNHVIETCKYRHKNPNETKLLFNYLSEYQRLVD